MRTCLHIEAVQLVLDVSIAGSAQRLQAQVEQNRVLQNDRLRQEIAAREVSNQRTFQERVRVERTAEDIDRSRLLREQIRDDTDARDIDDQRVRVEDEDRLFERTTRLEQDLSSAAQERLLERDIEQRDNPLAPLADLTSTAPPPANDEATLSQLLADRDQRRAERAAADFARDIRSEEDFARSQQAVNALGADASTLPDLSERGSVVDFSA